jgi:type IV pilus assembly protein PilA
LVVVAIIAILAAIAIPQYMRYSKKAYDAAALSDLKRIQTEAEAYYSDYSCYPH